MFSRFCERFALEIPIIQAPTGSVAGPELAAAVASAGAMGAMGVTWTPPEMIAEHMRQVRAVTEKPFLVNFALAFPPRGLQTALEAGAPVIAFSWGDPAPYLPQVRAAGAKVGVQAGNLAGARRAAQLGADLLLCQGIEAGGHVQSSTRRDALLREVREELGAETLLVAAGGIADAADIARALNAGADAVMMGTRFVATVESRAHPQYKDRLLQADSEAQTSLTVCFEGGWPYAPHRVLRNATLEAWEAAGCPPIGQRPGEGEIIAYAASGDPIYRYEDVAPRIGHTGAVAQMALYAGAGVGRITDLPKAGELTHRLWAEAQSLLRSGSL
jgi:nitronate monooxygenase